MSIATVKIYQIRPILGGPPLTDLSNLGSDGETKESCSGTSSHNTEDRASAAELMDDEHLNPDLGLVVDGGNYASADEAIDSDPIDSSVLKEISPQEQVHIDIKMEKSMSM